MSDDMTIHCAYNELLPATFLDTCRHPKNPNTHSAAQVSAIAAVLEGNGIRVPWVMSRRSNKMTRGHGRLDAALLLGIEHLPVNWQDYESEEAEVADMLADNRLAELAEMDDAKLAEVLTQLQAVGHDLALAGFSDADLDAIANAGAAVPTVEKVPRMELQAFEHYDYLVFMFADIRDWLRVLQLLKVVKVDYSISRKTQKIGIGRVINGKTLLGQLENPSRHHVEGQSGTNENAQATTESVPGGA